jgi:hypothetical protein
LSHVMARNDLSNTSLLPAPKVHHAIGRASALRNWRCRVSAGGAKAEKRLHALTSADETRSKRWGEAGAR